MATLIKPQTPYQSSKIDINPNNGTDFTLEELYKHLECNMIEVVYFNDNTIMIVDEEGKLQDKMINTDATYIFRKKRKDNDFIVGNAIVCNVSELK